MNAELTIHKMELYGRRKRERRAYCSNGTGRNLCYNWKSVNCKRCLSKKQKTENKNESSNG